MSDFFSIKGWAVDVSPGSKRGYRRSRWERLNGFDLSECRGDFFFSSKVNESYDICTDSLLSPLWHKEIERLSETLLEKCVLRNNAAGGHCATSLALVVSEGLENLMEMILGHLGSEIKSGLEKSVYAGFTKYTRFVQVEVSRTDLEIMRALRSERLMWLFFVHDNPSTRVRDIRDHLFQGTRTAMLNRQRAVEAFVERHLSKHREVIVGEDVDPSDCLCLVNSGLGSLVNIIIITELCATKHPAMRINHNFVAVRTEVDYRSIVSDVRVVPYEEHMFLDTPHAILDLHEMTVRKPNRQNQRVLAWAEDRRKTPEHTTPHSVLEVYIDDLHFALKYGVDGVPQCRARSCQCGEACIRFFDDYGIVYHCVTDPSLSWKMFYSQRGGPGLFRDEQRDALEANLSRFRRHYNQDYNTFLYEVPGDELERFEGSVPEGVNVTRTEHGLYFLDMDYDTDEIGSSDLPMYCAIKRPDHCTSQACCGVLLPTEA